MGEWGVGGGVGKRKRVVVAERQDEKENKRSDKTGSGELKLICFFDERRTPRI